MRFSDYASALRGARKLSILLIHWLGVLGSAVFRVHSIAKYCQDEEALPESPALTDKRNPLLYTFIFKRHKKLLSTACG
jgi:hypothetical protein